MTPSLELVLAQLNPCVGDLQANTDRAIALIREHRGSDLVVFTECFLSGYPVEDLVLRPGFVAAVERQVARLTDAVVELAGPAVIVGAPEEGPDLPYNAAYFISPDGSKKVARKIDLPNSTVFDEVRHFAPGSLRAPVLYRGVRIGIGICEEMWHPQVSRHLAGELADLLIFINGSPYTRGKHKGARLAHARARVRETGLPLVYLNQVGGQDELVFDGASFVLDDKGTLCREMPAFSEEVLKLTFPFGSQRPFQSYPSDVEADYVACVIGLRDYVDKNGFKNVVLGMSGGIDSALAGAMAVDALGTERVRALTLPSKVTSQENLSDAVLVCKQIGIPVQTMAIGSAVKAIQDMLFGPDDRVPGLTDENIQARVRMIALMGWSNEYGDMVVTTGNKSENSVGYATLYGDMAGGFNPLKDLYKTEVWDLARFRNGYRPLGMYGPRAPIPDHVISKPPSAELADGQTDEATLGPYAVLDALLRGIIDEDLDAAAALRRAMRELGDKVSDPLVAPFLTLVHATRIASLVRRAEYKRRQAAPGVKIGPRAFGRDRRYPIVNRYAL